LNQREADGFEGILSAFGDVNAMPRDQAWADQVEADFTLMGSIVNCYLPNGNELTDPWSNGNSRAAQLLYMSLFMPKANTISFTVSIFPPISISLDTVLASAGYDDSYATNFDFEKVGQSITSTAGF
jgi:hypothetical protein